ncbi:ATPase domain-containing protein [Methanolobus sp. ZRKC3]|uniref:RAD55 family ATPase n=1 Tax=Methanolobus sp. ZRKC3 TaxID=3125786 RepID=UPI00324317B6
MEIESTGIPGLDEILGGGIKPPFTMLIAGNPGTGRTTLGVQALCSAAREGETVLYVGVTSKSEDMMRRVLSSYDFFDEKVNIRTFNISSVERDPLTILVELSNMVTSLKPSHIVIDPVTPIGFGFPEAERRRFMYSLNSAIGEWNAIVYLTGTMSTEQLCRSVITDIVDGVVHLSQHIGHRKSKRCIRVVKFGTASYIEGEHAFEISTSGMSIYPRIEPDVLEPDWDMKRIKVGISGLDEHMGGGLLERSSTLIAGNTGTGKTLFGLQFIIEGALNGEVGIINSFEETPGELRYYASNFGLNLEELEEKELVKIIHTPPSEINSCKHAFELKENIERMEAKRVLIDDISAFDIVVDNINDKKGHISNLIRLFKNKGVTSVLIKGNMAAGSDILLSEIPISAIVDNLLLLRNLEIDKEIKKSLSILKMHGSSHEKHLINYDIGNNGIEIGTFLKDI